MIVRVKERSVGFKQVAAFEVSAILKIEKPLFPLYSCFSASTNCEKGEDASTSGSSQASVFPWTLSNGPLTKELSRQSLP